MTEYDKLVRDRIPEIISENGGSCKIHTVHGEEYTKYLDKKLDEEVAEFHEAKNLEELVDIYEVIVGLAVAIGYSEEELIECRSEKLKKRGGFSKGIILEES